MDKMLPEPALTFTIPSLHDNNVLDCRVYHPLSLSPSTKAPPWRKHAAIIAHPYGPLGGSYDDPIVDAVASTLLRLGFLIGTFNFRGAGGSAGRTSWTAKPEKADYMSVAGFIYHYIHFLDPFYDTPPTPSTSPSSPTKPPPTTITTTTTTPLLLLAGYSYGAMITTLLPPLPTILTPFAAPPTGSAAADIRLRAEHLAASQNEILASARAAKKSRGTTSSHRLSLGVRVGGEEDLRRSHDVKRSMSLDAEEKLRRGVAELMARGRSKRGRRSGGGGGEGGLASPTVAVAEKEEETLPVLRIPEVRVAYMMVSPPVGVVTSLATMSFGVPLFKRGGRKSGGVEAAGQHHSGSNATDERAAEQKLVMSPSLVVYGDADSFLSGKKIREWAMRLEKAPGSRFRAHEVSSAGHFWVEGRTLHVLRDAVAEFGETLLRDAGEQGKS